MRLRDAVLHRGGPSVDAVGCATARSRVPAAVDRGGEAGRHPELEVELGEEFAGASPGQTAVLLAGEAIVGHGTIAAAA